MKQFSNIFKFELMGYLKNKAFLGITITMVVLIGLVLYSPQIISLFKNENSDNASPESKEIVLVVDNSSTSSDLTLSIFKSAMPEYNVELGNKTVDEIRPLIESEAYKYAVIITSPTTYSYFVKNQSMYDSTKMVIDEIMLTKYRSEEMAKLGISPGQVNTVLNANIQSEVIQIGKDQLSNFFYTYILIFALYMAILLYGQLVATSVASEKNSRAMEMLITSAKPTNLMFGKVLGSGAAGLIQMVAIFGSSFIFFNLNKGSWGDNMIINSIFNMSLPILLYAILFFILGFFIYAFLYGAVGSLASKVEDINTSSMPITFLFVIAFFVVVYSMNTGDVDSPLMIAASYIPFTSPMAMFTRIAMGNVAAYEIIISVVILIGSTIGIGYISAQIYKIGVLLYGKPPKLSTVFKAIKNNK